MLMAAKDRIPLFSFDRGSAVAGMFKSIIAYPMVDHGVTVVGSSQCCCVR